MEATIKTKFDLRQCVYAIKYDKIVYGEICNIKVQKSREFSKETDWKVYYDMQVSESDGYFNIPEWKVHETQEEAEQALKLIKL